MLEVLKLGVTAVLFAVAAEQVAAQGSREALPPGQETTSARSIASDRQARIDEHNQRIHEIILESKKRLEEEQEAGTKDGKAPLSPERQKQLDALEKQVRELITLQEARAGTSWTREAQIRLHNERIRLIMEMSKIRRGQDGASTATSISTQSGGAEFNPFIPSSAAKTGGTTLTRQEEMRAHNERIRRIIEESQKRRAMNSTQTTATP